MSKRLIVVDISNFIFRAYYAIRPLNAPDGTPVNAVYGVLSMMVKLITQYRPTHIIIAQDTKEESFRKKMYDEYKANRSAPPDELIPQFGIIHSLVEKLQLPAKAIGGYEADDIIGSVVTQYRHEFQGEGDEILIASGDKDLMQFVDDHVKVLDTMKDKIYGALDVKEKMGVLPHQIVDFLSLIGDSSDNIPGVKGIGDKGAVKLLEEFNTLENCIDKRATLTNNRLKSALDNYHQDAYLSKKLVTIVCDLELGLKLKDMEFHFHGGNDLFDFLTQLGFKNIIQKVRDLVKVNGKKNQEEPESPTLEVKPAEQSNFNFLLEVIDSNEAWKNFFPQLKTAKQLAVFIKWRGEGIEQSPDSMALTVNSEKVFLLEGSDEKNGLFDEGKFGPNFQVMKDFLAIISLNDVELMNDDVKSVFNYARKNNLPLPTKYFDITQAFYNINTDANNSLENCSKVLMGLELFSLSKNAESIEKQKEEERLWVIERTLAIAKLRALLHAKLVELDLEKVFYDIDSPLIPVLSKMEFEGILLDKNFFFQLEREFDQELERIQKEIIAAAGEDFNLKSPKQVAHILFEKLKLPIIKKTKTGASTDSDVLDELSGMGLNPIPALLLKFRELDKLQSTYVRVFPKLINSSTGRLHTTFLQNNAATGRLSSENPNLQNIPIRTENGRRLRKGFVARPGHKLISADYSQVELRLLAHFAEDPTMLKAFSSNQDIHAQTAAEVFSIPLEQVTSEQRSGAKAINFGLMYGQSSFGLSQNLKISQGEAKNYITMYFTRFNRIKSYLDHLKELCEEKGYAETLMGRKRFLPDIHAQNRMVKAMAERIAINSPIQGTAADIIKLAMIQLDQRLNALKSKAKLLLQVHDELIVEAPFEEVERIAELMKDVMESAVRLRTPLKVDVGEGDTWLDA